MPRESLKISISHQTSSFAFSVYSLIINPLHFAYYNQTPVFPLNTSAPLPEMYPLHSIPGGGKND